MSKSYTTDASNSDALNKINSAAAKDGSNPSEKRDYKPAKIGSNFKINARGYSPGLIDNKPAVPQPPPKSGSNVSKPSTKT
ncbi:MAG: hypothetical protein LBO66_04945 [Deltaproteobacteria bacterium]|nr:hypothetical protein [Deltaproteobacteria bacterium]